MTPQTSLEIKGNLVAHAAAELVSEIIRAKLTGSLRLEQKDQKAVLYFKSGRLSFAVSNSRKARLFDILISRGSLERETLADIPNFSSDFELAAQLETRQLLTRQEIGALVTQQIAYILIDAFCWMDGSWTFSSLARLRDGLDYSIDVRPILIQYARCLPSETVLKRLRLAEDSFSRSEVSADGLDLLPDEVKILDVCAEKSLDLRKLFEQSLLTQDAAVGAIYSSWLIGLLNRENWHPAFPQSAVIAIRGARLELKREATRIQITQPEPSPQFPAPTAPVAELSSEDVIESLDEYLARVESAATYYDVLGVGPSAEQDAIKRAYLSLVKQFHPDHFHKAAADLGPRVQTAFAALSKAYETLKTPESRELSDFRVRKELAEREKLSESGLDKTTDDRLRQAQLSFDHAIEVMRGGDMDNALPFFARAAHFDPTNARYRAEYGLILSNDPKEKHTAEAELQAAIGLAPDPPTYRVRLAKFFISIGLQKRAEGEIGRLQKAFPQNGEALALLESLR